MSATMWRSTLTLPVSPGRDHITGPADGPVTLVEYGDYECPYCAAAHPIVKTILGQAGNAVRYVFRHFPLTTMHPHAELAAEAAEASGKQGKFWSMHDMLYANQRRLDAPALLGYAATLGLDSSRVSHEIAAHAHLPKISEDFMSGVRSGVNGTPAFYINGFRHDGGWDYASLTTALRDAASTSTAA